MSNSEDILQSAAIQNILHHQNSLISKRMRIIEHVPTDQEKVAKIAKLKAKISANLHVVSGLKSVQLETYFSKLEVSSAKPNFITEEKVPLKKQLQEEQKNIELLLASDKHSDQRKR